MKKNIRFWTVRGDRYGMQYADGVSAADKKRAWAQSPWDAFRLLLQGAEDQA